MTYFIIFILLIFMSLWETLISKIPKFFFYVFFGILAILAVLRFGVGTDYFNYNYLYNQIPNILQFDVGYLQSIHGEWGFKLSIVLAKSLGVSYVFYNLLVTAFSMMILLRFFMIYVKKNYILGLLIFYSMYYFTYINSGIRQGFVLIAFLGIALPLLSNDKWIKYTITILLLSLFHVSILIVLILPILKVLNFKIWFTVGLIFSFSIAAISFVQQRNILLSLFHISAYSEDTGGSLSALLFRLISLIIVVLISNIVKMKDLPNEIGYLIYFYMYGFLLYLMLSNNTLISSRIHVYFRALELIILPYLISSMKLSTRRIIGALLIIIIYPVFWIKEIMAQLYQGNYYNTTSVLDYSYVSVFEKEKIYKLRNVIFDVNTL